MESKKNLLNHFLALKKAIELCDLKISLDCQSFIATVTDGRSQHKLYPQFISFRDDTKQYVNDLEDDVKFFSGWRPYECLTLPTFTNRQLFKQHIKQNKLLTPEHSFDHSTLTKNVIIKSEGSSFSKNIRGPFKSSSNLILDKSKHEYFERFIPGSIIKIWFWNKWPACYETQAMPKVKGDGKKTIEEILELRTFIRRTKIDYRQLFEVLDYFDCDKDTILDDEQLQTVDFRYGSTLARRNAIREFSYPFSEQQQNTFKFQEISDALWPIICDEHNDNLLYTVDAILDSNDQLWILEANSNPMVHPCTYPIMIKSFTDQSFNN